MSIIRIEVDIMKKELAWLLFKKTGKIEYFLKFKELNND